VTLFCFVVAVVFIVEAFNPKKKSASCFGV